MNNSEIIERMKITANVKEDQELAKIFGLGKTAVANWKRGTVISLAHIFEFVEKYDVSFDWLLTGKSKENKLDTSERMLLTAFEELDDNQKMQAVVFVGSLAQGQKTEGGSISVSGDNNISNMNGTLSIKQ